MISYDKKCIFVHIPKTGGTSIERVIWKKISAQLLFGSPNRYHTGGLQHLKARFIKTEVGEDVFNSFFKFAFVRNPWSKALSQYFYTIQTRDDLRRILRLPKNASFEDYVKSLEKVSFEQNRLVSIEKVMMKIPKLNQPYLTRLHIQWDKQFDFLFDENGNKMVDFIGKFENLQNDFNHISEQLNLNVRTLPHVTHGVVKSKQQHFTQYYNGTTKAIIANLYKKDIEAFGYEFK